MELPELEDLRALEQEEIGFLVLQWIHGNPQRLSPNKLGDPYMSFGNVRGMYTTDNLPKNDREEIERLISEGWHWLEIAGLIVNDPRQSNPEFKALSRRGKEIVDRNTFNDFRTSRLLPDALIHPDIISKARPHILRSDYETAILVAFRQVEINVRRACGYGDSEIGVSLMRSAFQKETGPLTDSSLITAEQENMQHLFAGSIGSFKNPSSHRAVAYTADEAVELLYLASRLLKIVDSRIAGAST